METIIALTGKQDVGKTTCLHTLAFLLSKVCHPNPVRFLGKTASNWPDISKEIDVEFKLPNGKTVVITTRGDSKKDVGNSYKKVKIHSSPVDLWVTASHEAYTEPFLKVQELAQKEEMNFWTEVRITENKTVVCYEKGKRLDTRVWVVSLMSNVQGKSNAAENHDKVEIEDANGNKARVCPLDLAVAQELFALIISKIGCPTSGIKYACTSVVNKI